MLGRKPSSTLVAAVASALFLAAAAPAATPVAKRFPAPGAKRATVKTVRIAFRSAVRSGALTVRHEGVKVTPFTAGLVDGGRALQASFPDGLPRGHLKIGWRIRTADGVRRTGDWSFQVTTGSASHDHG